MGHSLSVLADLFLPSDQEDQGLLVHPKWKEKEKEMRGN